MSGEIDIGKGIVEKEYQKVAISKTGEVTIKTFKVEGRKHPLSSIRKKRFLKYSMFMRLNNNSYFESLEKEQLLCRLKSIGELNCNETADDMREKIKQFERTRDLQVWHDASDIATHGHILFCINILYDPAVFLPQKEFKEKFDLDVNVQRKIETPELYIIGRCRNNDEQLGYIQTRGDCLKDLEKQLNIVIAC